ncbi:hypothetical protein H2200_005905 [Cladophialophora chaetospira]|uniref:Zn(2)-C6 fungal-type domain-containing protein n=1 Tax=Cladophialophora chaetospira TaxID=386627 RepID=A0AA38XA15_9EURO|nr:hypothetical protein H2200_005905 [Cladophialophora chaetospira]
MSTETSAADSDGSPPPPPRAMLGDKARTKKWAPKTFNGCMTCKKRRIKCDEGKPSCQRCFKSNIRCGGYAPPKIRLFDPSSSLSLSTATPQALPPTAKAAFPADPEVPKAQDPNDLQLQSQLHSFPHPRELALVPKFGTQEEYHSFQFFLEKTSDLISVYSDPYLWGVLLPQATYHQPSIKHSIIALACLHQSLTTLGPISERAKHNFMFHYNTAIRALVVDKPPIDIVLAACVIFWALENFNGSGQAAFDHMKAAIKILGEWKSKPRINDTTNDFISKYIEPSIIDGIKYASKCRIEELASQMSALSLTSRDVRIMNADHPAFDNLEDAEKYLGECIHNILTLKSQTQAQITLHGDDTVLIKELEEIEELDVRLYRWMHLFQKLTATGPVYMRRMLIVHNVAANILLDQLKKQAKYTATQEEQEREKDHDSPDRAGRSRHDFVVIEVEDMLQYDPLVAAESSRKTPPALGLIPPLLLVATSAERIETRRRAISVLNLLHVIEGPWSSDHAARIAESMLEIAKDHAGAVAAVQMHDMSFDFDDEDQTLRIDWEPDDAVLSSTTLERTVDVSGMDWQHTVSPF